MPQSPGNQSPEQPSADFGANEWLVEEMYDQYQRDPGSVDPTWAKYFQANGGANGAVATPEKSEDGAKPAKARADFVVTTACLHGDEGAARLELALVVAGVFVGDTQAGQAAKRSAIDESVIDSYRSVKSAAVSRSD